MCRLIYFVLPKQADTSVILTEIRNNGFSGREWRAKNNPDISLFSASSGSETCAFGVPHTVFLTGEALQKSLEEDSVIKRHYERYTQSQRAFIENLRFNQQKRFAADAARWLDLIHKLFRKNSIPKLGVYWCYPPKYAILSETEIALEHLNKECLYSLVPNRLLNIFR